MVRLWNGNGAMLVEQQGVFTYYQSCNLKHSVFVSVFVSEFVSVFASVFVCDMAMVLGVRPSKVCSLTISVLQSATIREREWTHLFQFWFYYAMIVYSKLFCAILDLT